VLRTARESANMARHLRSGVARVHAARRAERGCTYERGDTERARGGERTV